MGLLVRLWAGQEASNVHRREPVLTSELDARAPACFHAVLKCFLYFKSHRGLLSTYFPL